MEPVTNEVMASPNKDLAVRRLISRQPTTREKADIREQESNAQTCFIRCSLCGVTFEAIVNLDFKNELRRDQEGYIVEWQCEDCDSKLFWKLMADWLNPKE